MVWCVCACKSTAAAQSLTSLPHTRTVPAGEDTTPFAKWLPSSVTYLNSKFDEKETVKALGAKWDPVKRQWYVPSGMDTTPFAKWLPGGASASAPSAASPVATGAGPTNGSTQHQRRAVERHLPQLDLRREGYRQGARRTVGFEGCKMVRAARHGYGAIRQVDPARGVMES